jgi:succinyl-CoA synthetase beta subunit
MKIHEYQAKQILSRHGVAVPAGDVAQTAAEAGAIAERLKADLYAVKAQVHAGGRGKGGGVRLVQTPGEVQEAASRILSAPLVTAQTGPRGRPVRKVLAEAGLAIEREMYVGLTLDREARSVVLLACAEGGVEIEAIAARFPEKIIQEEIHVGFGLREFQCRRIGAQLRLSNRLFGSLTETLTTLARLFVESDCSLLELNPLALTKTGEFVVVDAKMAFDDNALFRHPDIAALRDPDEESPIEAEAEKGGLSYISLDGTIGCLVNGAGLAMATMDIIKLYGGQPANFLDVGGGADLPKVSHAFRIILADPKVRAVLVSIFGGIMKCDVIAAGIISAVKETGIKAPLVVRLEGTNVEEGRKLLRESGLQIIPAHSMAEAAQKAVATAK